MRGRFGGVVAALFPLALVAGQARAAARPPNVILIVADDLGYGDLGSYGNRRFATPHLDQLARDGLRFTQFYANAPICTPSRGALLTGRAPARLGLPGALFPKSRGGLALNEVTLADALKRQGYATWCVGKWHLGLGDRLPTHRGFESYFGIPYSIDMTPLVLMRDTTIVERASKDKAEEQRFIASLTARYMEEARRHIAEAKDRPFFLYLAHSVPHVPNVASAAYQGRSQVGEYADVVQELDASVGAIRKAVEDAGLERDTLLLFTSDNGSPNPESNAPLRGAKRSYFEGGLRVPCLAVWKGRLTPGRVASGPATLLDWFPTLLALAGAAVPQDVALDGADLRPLLFGTSAAPPRRLYWGRYAVRDGDLKLIRISGEDGPLGAPQLYDLARDPGEKQDLAKERPRDVARLEQELQRHEAELRKRPARASDRAR